MKVNERKDTDSTFFVINLSGGNFVREADGDGIRKDF